MRHGTKAAYNAGCRCDGCRIVQVLYRPTPKKHAWHPTRNVVSAAPYRRFLRALIAEGASRKRIADLSGVSYQALYLIETGQTTWMQLGTARKLRGLLEHLPSKVSA